jgi:RNA polymerase sigma factor (sigma-70 family)
MSGFQTTRWSQVMAAGNGDTGARSALESLCRAYRGPVLSFVRHLGHGPGEAEDLTQQFFVHFLEHRVHAAADRERGRFRTLLRSALRNFLIEQHEHAHAAKRGGGRVLEALDETHERVLAEERRDAPDRVFDRAWAATVIDRAADRMRRDAVRAGKGALFDRLREFLLESPQGDDYAEIARELDVRPNQLAVTVHRMRAKLRDCLRAELLETVSSHDGLREELEALREVLAATE